MYILFFIASALIIKETSGKFRILVKQSLKDLTVKLCNNLTI